MFSGVMERIGIVGIGLQDTDVGNLERVRRPREGEPSRFLLDLADTLAASEVVVLATCNRVEVVFARESGHLPARADVAAVGEHLGLPSGDPLRERLHLWTGRDAARHLFRVASSLDSVVLGEDQILAQVRAAFVHAESRGLCGRLLGPLFESAFQVGKQVRTQTSLSRHPISVASVGLSILRARIGEDRPRIAVVGAGKMGSLAARDARDLGLQVSAIVNRTPDSARALAAELDAALLSIDRLAEDLEPVDAIVSATASPDTVIDRATLLAIAARRPSGKPLVAVDLALPRDIEPVDHPSVDVVDLDTVRALADENRGLRASAAVAAEALVEAKVRRFCERQSRHLTDAALAELRDESSEVAERELAELFHGRLEALDPQQRLAVERWARRAFGRLNHVSISAIKRLVTHIPERIHAQEGTPE